MPDDFPFFLLPSTPSFLISALAHARVPLTSALASLTDLAMETSEIALYSILAVVVILVVNWARKAFGSQEKKFEDYKYKGTQHKPKG